MATSTIPCGISVPQVFPDTPLDTPIDMAFIRNFVQPTLTIAAVVVTDVGDYRCTAYNTAGSDESAPAALSLLDVPASITNAPATGRNPLV